TYCEGVHIVSTRTMAGEAVRKARRIRRIGSWLHGYRPGAIKLMYSSELRNVLEGLAVKADVVHVARLAMTSHTEHLATRGGRPRLVLDLDDVETSFRFRELRYGPRESLLHHAYGYYDLARLWAYQARAVRQFDRVFVSSGADRKRFAGSNVV